MENKPILCHLSYKRRRKWKNRRTKAQVVVAIVVKRARLRTIYCDRSLINDHHHHHTEKHWSSSTRWLIKIINFTSNKGQLHTLTHKPIYMFLGSLLDGGRKVQEHRYQKSNRTATLGPIEQRAINQSNGTEIYFRNCKKKTKNKRNRTKTQQLWIKKLTFKRLIKMKERKSKDEYKIVCVWVCTN